MGIGGFLNAQDIHFTMFDMAPINLNPVYTGFYSGSFRVGGIYRSQWQGLGLNVAGLSDKFSGFQTPSAFADVALGIPPKNGAEMKSWLGVGINFYNDQVDRLSTMRAELSVAYHLGLGKRGRTRISLGVKGGIYQSRVKDITGYVFEDEIIGGINTSTDDAVFGANQSSTAPDFSAGLMVAHRGTGWGIEVAGSINHFTQPKLNFGTNVDYKLPSNIIASIRTTFALGNKFSVRPKVFMQLMTKVLELNAQAVFAYHFTNTKDVNLLFGGGYRLGDAAFARVGFEYKGLTIGGAYDFNLSSLSVSGNNFNGVNPRAMGFEVAVTYIAKIYKDIVIEEVLYNPRF
jgi:type IX secretion system PorP/SprF family membrane protein